MNETNEIGQTEVEERKLTPKMLLLHNLKELLECIDPCDNLDSVYHDYFLNFDWDGYEKRYYKEIGKFRDFVIKLAVKYRINITDEQVVGLADELYSDNRPESTIVDTQSVLEITQLYYALCRSTTIKIGTHTVSNSDWIFELLKKETKERAKQLFVGNYFYLCQSKFFEDANEKERKECIDRFKEKLQSAQSIALESSAYRLGSILHPNLIVMKNGKQMKYFPKKEAAFIYDLLTFEGVIDNKNNLDESEKYDRIKRFLKPKN